MKDKYFYDRYLNPTAECLNDLMARLDYAKYGHSFASGMAAWASILTLFKNGD